MNSPVRQRSVCPHDCPSVCALDIEVLDENRIGKVYGAKDHSYTQGVICAKVSRYSERVHHPERITTPLKRLSSKSATRNGEDAKFEAISWDEALDTIAQKFLSVVEQHGAQSIWPYHYAGTMGLVQRDGLDRFRNVLGTTRQHSTFCTALSDAGFLAGVGSKRGSDPRLMIKSDLIVVWGGNPVSTQVNVMNFVSQAKRTNNAKFVVVDPYRTKTADKADMHLMLRPGTDGALACAVMHVLFEEGYADEEYLAKYTDRPEDFKTHLHTKTPEWAAAITGLLVEEIVAFARLYGESKKSFLRLGYGFTRSRNGAVNMHAVSCLPAVTGAWQHEGGGALYSNASIYALDKARIQGSDVNCNTRIIDQSRIGHALQGNSTDLQGGPAIHALFIQNTNPAVVAPETHRVLDGLSRDNLFTVVHEQFMTETAQYADIILPATMFLEHDDIYTAGGHTHLQVGKRLINPPGECRSNHEVLQALASRLGLEHAGFSMSARELIDDMLSASNLPSFDEMVESGGHDCAMKTLESSNFLDGFDTPDKRFHFSPDWNRVGSNTQGIPEFPDHWAVTDESTDVHPLRMVTAPARQFLNTSFTETPSARRMEKCPCVRIHPDDLARYHLKDEQLVTLGNELSEVSLVAKAFDGVQLGTVIVEGIWPNKDFIDGVGVNSLVSSEPGKPNGGAVFHDTAVWIKAYSG